MIFQYLVKYYIKAKLSSTTVSLPGNKLKIYETSSTQWKTNITKNNVEVEEYMLSQNYPDPFNPTTTIDFSIAKSSLVNLTVYNSLGKEVGVLVNNNMSEGNYSVTFDASTLSSGIYFYRLETNNYSETKKMILMK